MQYQSGDNTTFGRYVGVQLIYICVGPLLPYSLPSTDCYIGN